MCIIFCKNISCIQLNLAMNYKPQQKWSGENLTNWTGGAAPEYQMYNITGLYIVTISDV